MNRNQIDFRDLRADEIDCRIATITDKGLTLLLYKDARVDQNILDETVGNLNWKREHEEIKGNIYCGISIYNYELKEWITKWDCGKESYNEAEKGEASDSFKRAGFNWGIGRELYTSPFIYITSNKCNITTGVNGKRACYDKFKVYDLKIKDKKIAELKIKNMKTGENVYTYTGAEDTGAFEDGLLSDTEAKRLYKALINKLGSNDNVVDYLVKNYNVDNTSKLLKSQYVAICKEMK